MNSKIFSQKFILHMGKGAHTTDNAFPSFLQCFLQHDGLLFLLLELTHSLPQATTSVTSIEYHNSLLVPIYIGGQLFESRGGCLICHSIS